MGESRDVAIDEVTPVKRKPTDDILLVVDERCRTKDDSKYLENYDYRDPDAGLLYVMLPRVSALAGRSLWRIERRCWVMAHGWEQRSKKLSMQGKLKKCCLVIC